MQNIKIGVVSVVRSHLRSSTT